MSGIPQTRTIDQMRRVNIPAEIASAYPPGQQFESEMHGSDIILTPTESADARTLTEKNRVRVRPAVAREITDNTEFAVITDGETIILRPTENVNIDI